ncbi:dimethylarginine dimethylaminohydrolase family protein [Fredinandcohnia sp. 179-A 10B2 NHS]|uniref:dimethylarginine dimethylaminohydrolase family protein n=1 Tax=Fredinandcohnia sp. 179-A 10B2 NHS TaxID=3235176 RepID=UPI0039A0D9CC
MSTGKRYLSRNLVLESFQDKTLLQEIWGESWGVSSDVGRLKKVLLHRPGTEIQQLEQNPRVIEAGGLLADYIKGTRPEDLQDNPKADLDILQSQHSHLVKALQDEGVEIVYLEGQTYNWPERVFTRDLGLVIPGGVILSRLALYIRYGETPLLAKTLSNLGAPLLGCIQGNGFVEGGSFTMLDEKTAIIGRSERVNSIGIEQLRFILTLQEIDLITVDLPSTIIHLDEAFLLLDRNKALINKTLLPYWFIDELHRRKIELIHVDPRDPALSINVLPVSPGRVIFPSTGVRTMEVLQNNGIEVIPVDVSEFYKLGGGIHCLTLPLIREPVS